MAARNRIARRDGLARRPDATGSVFGTLAVAAGYGLVVSVLLVVTVDWMFGARGSGGRLAVLGMTVGALVVGAAVMRVGRSWRRRRVSWG